MGLLPVWVPLLVVARAFLVDGLRSASYADGMTPFGEHNMMRSKLTAWLTAGRPMRAFFGFAKAAAFLFLGLVAAHRLPGGQQTVLGRAVGWPAVYWAGWVLVWAAVALTVIRALPVVVDALAYLREKGVGRAANA
jgi:CDP-diacylglycerol--glycerol-3-phosphate 3-phosphatidyltransferase